VNIKLKINGRSVSQAEWDQYSKDRGSLLEEMLESRKAPGVKTDDTFLAGVGNLDRQIEDPLQLEAITQNAIRHGYRPAVSDFYNPMLADFEGDPKAFLNHGQGRAHVKKVLESKGQWMDRDGDVHSVEPLEDPFKNPLHKLSPKIVRRIKGEKFRENPDLLRADQKELESNIVETHGWNEDR
jgi:hypothetical protein